MGSGAAIRRPGEFVSIQSMIADGSGSDDGDSRRADAAGASGSRGGPVGAGALARGLATDRG
jgi:hypothetical protein